jgi:hypothetical protein
MTALEGFESVTCQNESAARTLCTFEKAHTHFIVTFIAPVRSNHVFVRGIATATHSGIPIHSYEISVIHANTAIHNVNNYPIY